MSQYSKILQNPLFCPLVKKVISKYTSELSNALIIDLREDYEYSGFNIPGSINLPLSSNSISDIQKAIYESNASEVIFICFCGKRSAEVLDELDCKYRVISKAYKGGIYIYKKRFKL